MQAKRRNAFVKMKKMHDSFSRWPGREQTGAWGSDSSAQGTGPIGSPPHSHAAPAPVSGAPSPVSVALGSAASELNQTEDNSAAR